MKRRISMVLALLIFVGALQACSVNENVQPGTQSQGTIPSVQITQPTIVPTDPTLPSVPPVATIPSQPQETEPVPTEPAPTEPEPTEPAPTEPLPTEPSEPVKPLPDLQDEDFVRVIDYIPTIRQALAYATTDNFTGQVIYPFTDAYLRWGTVKKLMAVADDLEELGLGLLIWDAYRPTWAQQKLWDVCPDPKYVSPPGTGIQSHCRGIAVDVTLVDLQSGQLLEMPSGFDEFSPLGDRDYSDCSKTAAENAQLLETVMESHGFQGYSGEWWHFADSVSYPIEEYFDPELGYIWVANCNRYINLRKTPGGDVILDQIPKNGQMQLLGWKDKSARVCYEGTVGYVSANYIMPWDQWLEKNLETVEITGVYTHEQLLADLQTMAEKYPDLVEVEIVGSSELGRQIPVLRIGPEDAAQHVLLQGAIHGREHATAWLLMAMADYWLTRGMTGMEDVCFHILPMVNPDGVTISQTGVLNDLQREIYKNDLRLGYTKLSEKEYAARWKANGLGVDINRNFSAGWELVTERGEASSQQYRGEAAFSSAEAQALRDYTLRYPFGVTVSYHATGSLTYYSYGSNTGVNRQGKLLAEQMKAFSGYAPTGSYGLDGAGYKDWVIQELQISSLTVEIGCASAPLHKRELYSIFARNYLVLPMLADWA